MLVRLSAIKVGRPVDGSVIETPYFCVEIEPPTQTSFWLESRNCLQGLRDQQKGSLSRRRKVNRKGDNIEAGELLYFMTFDRGISGLV